MALNSCQFRQINQRTGVADDEKLEKCSHRNRTIYRIVNPQSAGHEDLAKVTEICSILIKNVIYVAMKTELRMRAGSEVLKTL